VIVAESETGEPDGRTRQRLATRERVFQAAIRAFVAHGYDGATMEEIAAEAGVSRRTAFYIFPAKSDIAVEWAVRRGQLAFELIGQTSHPARPAPERVRAYFHELAVMTERDWDETRQLTTAWLRGYGSPGHRSWLSGELRDWLHEWLRVQQDGRPPREGWDPALVTEVLFDVYQGVLMRWMQRRAPEPGGFTAEVDAAIAFVLAGLGRTPGA
jgi:AcrR family transcriptional regulator